jgi:peroxiredoxin
MIRWLFAVVLLPLALHAEGARVAPRFTLNDLSSREVRLADLQGKVILLSFWASWSKPCLDEMPEMEALWMNYKGRRLMVLGINEDEADNLAAVKKAVSDQKITHPVLLDPTHAVRLAYGVEKLPCLILIDHHGIINRAETGYPQGGERRDSQKPGPAGLDSLEVELQNLLAESEARPTLSVGAVLAADLSLALKEKVRKAIEAQVKGVRNYRFVPPDDADFELLGSVAKLGNSVGLALSLVDRRTRNVVKHAADSASESEIEATVGKMIKQMGLK